MAAMMALQASRELMLSKGMTEEEIDDVELKSAARILILVSIILAVTILVFVVFDEEQFCFVHDFKEFFTTPGEYLRHNFGWLVK
jgi:hypothetical protein